MRGMRLGMLDVDLTIFSKGRRVEECLSSILISSMNGATDSRGRDTDKGENLPM